MVADLRDVSTEFSGVQLPDRRLKRRLIQMVGELARDPSASFPKAFGDVAGTEGGYRFLRNPRIVPDALFKPHCDQSWARAQKAKTVLSIEDTTELRFGGRTAREGLGPLPNNGQGFFLHAALLVDFGAIPRPLGVGNFEFLVRNPDRKISRKSGVSWITQYHDPAKERLRWHRVAEAVRERAATAQVEVIHVADREADDYALLSQCAVAGGRFVIRMRFDRRDGREDELASEILARAPSALERELQVATRTQKRAKRPMKSTTPQPRHRQAKVVLRATTVQFSRPVQARTSKPTMTLNLVEVIELEPPEGEPPVHWRLLTTEPIATAADVERVVAIYRARWLIEEYWKALKTGCAFEERQLESRKTIETALALLLPLAWHLLVIRSVSRATPDAPAIDVVTPRHLDILKRIARKKNRWGLRLPEEPTARDIAHGIGRLGGHLRHNGEPGWQILRRGLDQLLLMDAALEFLEQERCDQ